MPCKDFNWREDAMRADRVTYEVVTYDELQKLCLSMPASRPAYQGMPVTSC